jgi:hypothetical protein
MVGATALQINQKRALNATSKGQEEDERTSFGVCSKVHLVCAQPSSNRFRSPCKLITLYAKEEEGDEDNWGHTVFIMHQDFAGYYSPVLKAAIDNTCPKYDCEYILLRSHKNTVGSLVHWLYTQTSDVHQEEDMDKEDLKKNICTLAQL